jgi:hypothetical protein
MVKVAEISLKARVNGEWWMVDGEWWMVKVTEISI